MSICVSKDTKIAIEAARLKNETKSAWIEDAIVQKLASLWKPLSPVIFLIFFAGCGSDSGDMHNAAYFDQKYCQTAITTDFYAGYDSACADYQVCFRNSYKDPKEISICKAEWDMDVVKAIDSCGGNSGGSVVGWSDNVPCIENAKY